MFSQFLEVWAVGQERVEQQRVRKWRWAGHALRQKDGRWARQMLYWVPHGGERRRGRPATRWEDALEGCQRAWTKVGDLGGRQQRLADGRSWTCEESEDARRQRSQISIFQVTAAFSPRSYGVQIFQRGSLSLSCVCGFVVLYALALVSHADF